MQGGGVARKACHRALQVQQREVRHRGRILGAGDSAVNQLVTPSSTASSIAPRVAVQSPRPQMVQQRHFASAPGSPVPRVLFLCTGNSCRSQMAEGWARHFYRDSIESHSAGTETHGMNPWAQRVMKEAGVPLDGHYSKTLDEISEKIKAQDAANGQPNRPVFDVVFTVCDHAAQSCPTHLLQGSRTVHTPFDDPPKLAKTAKTEEETLQCYRKVRDEIRDFMKTAPEIVEKEMKKR